MHCAKTSPASLTVEGLQDTQTAEMMQQNAVLTCLDGAPATIAEHACTSSRRVAAMEASQYAMWHM
jgi:hypothetical protein